MPRRRRASFPVSQLGSGMSGKRVCGLTIAITAGTPRTARNRASQPEFRRNFVASAGSAGCAATLNARCRGCGGKGEEEPVDRDRSPRRRSAEAHRPDRQGAATFEPSWRPQSPRRASRAGRFGRRGGGHSRLTSSAAGASAGAAARSRHASSRRPPRRPSPPRTLASPGR